MTIVIMRRVAEGKQLVYHRGGALVLKDGDTVEWVKLRTIRVYPTRVAESNRLLVNGIVTSVRGMDRAMRDVIEQVNQEKFALSKQL